MALTGTFGDQNVRTWDFLMMSPASKRYARSFGVRPPPSWIVQLAVNAICQT